MYLHPRESNRALNSHNYPQFQVDETLLSQGSGSENEDVLSVENSIFIVCDGATTITDSASGHLVNGGRRAAEITAAVFSQNNNTLQHLAERANDTILRAMIESGVDLTDRKSLWSTSFAALRFTGNSFEWSQAGDCMIMLIYEDGSSRLVTRQTGHDVPTLQRWKKVGPDQSGTIHEVLAEEIGEVRKQMNRTYGVLNGESEALGFIASGIEDLHLVTDILLFSDGMWLPSESPENPIDIDEMARLYRHKGLVGLTEQIRCLQQQDPRCCHYPRFKMHDDISGIALGRRDTIIQAAYHKNN